MSTVLWVNFKKSLHICFSRSVHIIDGEFQREDDDFLDYKDNFHAMIARYNRELLETYRRQNAEEPPTAKVTPVMAIPEDTRTPLLAPTEPAPPRTMPMELGYLQVWVTTASTALPIEGAHVTVSYDSSGGERRTAQYVGATDESGRTETIPLPAVSAQASLSLDGDATPFTLYNIEVFADGFYRVENLGVPMYGGVRAVQPVRLIPLPEGTPSGEITYRDSAPQGLEERA